MRRTLAVGWNLHRDDGGRYPAVGDPKQDFGFCIDTKALWKRGFAPVSFRAVVQTQHGGTSPHALDALEAVAFGAVAVTTRALASVGLELTFAQWRALVIVGESPDGASVSEIAERVGSELSPASRLVARMASRGLVELDKDPGDRRVTRVTLTPAGADARTSVLNRRLALLTAVIAAAGPISAEAVDGLLRIGAVISQYS